MVRTRERCDQCLAPDSRYAANFLCLTILVSLGVAEKSWIFGSRVGPQHFHVPLEKLQLAEMIERTKKGGAALVQGGFRSGKTSHLKACKSAISDRFIPIEYVLMTLIA